MEGLHTGVRGDLSQVAVIRATVLIALEEIQSSSQIGELARGKAKGFRNPANVCITSKRL